MRIAFITPEFVTEESYAGGLANYLERVSRALSDRGHDVHVFTKSGLDEVIEREGVTIHRVWPVWDRKMRLDHVDPLVPRKLYNPYQDLKLAWKLRQRWRQSHRQEPFDLVQVTNVSATGFFFRSERRLPVITRASSYRPDWDTEAGIPVTLGVRARWAMERRAITGTRFVFAPSRFVARRMESAYGIKVGVIESPFFIESSRLDDSVLKSTVGVDPYGLFFGRLTQMKGVHILAQALTRALAAMPDLRFVFVGPDSLAPDGGSMKSHVTGVLAPFRNRIIILDSLRHDRLYPIIQAARLVVLPSIIDNLPNAALEAMGLGKPIIATLGSCFEDLIDHDKSGFLVPAAEPGSLAAEIERVWRLPPEDLERIGKLARQRAAQLHPDFTIPKLLEYYEAALDTFHRATRRPSP